MVSLAVFYLLPPARLSYASTHFAPEKCSQHRSRAQSGSPRRKVRPRTRLRPILGRKVRPKTQPFCNSSTKLPSGSSTMATRMPGRTVTIGVEMV